MSSDGGDPIDPNQALNTLANVAVNVATLGVVGVDEGGGGLKAGAVARAVDEGVGELTTRNLQRRASMKPMSAWRPSAPPAHKSLPMSASSDESKTPKPPNKLRRFATQPNPDKICFSGSRVKGTSSAYDHTQPAQSRLSEV